VVSVGFRGSKLADLADSIILYRMRVLAIIATYNEERFIGGCLEHLFANGVDVYLCDNQSTDRTVEIASRHLGAGLRGIEQLPRDGTFRWRQILRRKEALAAELDADWYIHLDADEILLPPRSGQTLREAFAEAEVGGYNAVELAEFTFVPTREDPDHDHPDFRRTMRWYYPFSPSALHLVRGWQRQPRVDLASTGGHNVRFPDLRLSPALPVAPLSRPQPGACAAEVRAKGLRPGRGSRRLARLAGQDFRRRRRAAVADRAASCGHRRRSRSLLAANHP